MAWLVWLAAAATCWLLVLMARMASDKDSNDMLMFSLSKANSPLP
ncbi:MAG: hypothetical protein RLZZ329_2337 [Pseudomonadota bacterium]